MNLTPASRTEMYRQIRVILVRHLIDIGRLSIQMSASSVRLHGSLVRLPGVTSPLTPEMVGTIMSEIGRVDGVRRVISEFDNWTQAHGMGAWHLVEKASTTTKPTTPTDESASSQTIEIDDT
jgi:hypothetical protein